MGKFAKSPMQKPGKVSILMLELASESLTRQCGYGSCCGYKIPVNFLDALHIFRVRVAQIRHALWGADACTTTLRSDGSWFIVSATHGRLYVAPIPFTLMI
jgi:hypothetical protein